MPRGDFRLVLLSLPLLAVSILGEFLFPISHVLMALGAVLLIFDLFSRPISLASDEIWALIALGWAGVAAVAASGDRAQSQEFLGIWFMSWIIWVTVRRGGYSGKKILAVLLLGGGMLVAGGIIVLSVVSASMHTGGLLENPNFSAALILPVIPFLFLLFRARFRPVILSLVLFLAVILSGSRAGILGIIALLLLLLPPGKLRRVIFFGMSPLVFLGLAWRLLFHYEHLAWFRGRIWLAVLSFIRDHPFFGSGAGALGDVMGPYRIPHPAEPAIWGHIIGAAENLPLGIAAHLGIPGLILLSVASAIFLLRNRPLSRPRIAILVAFAAFGFFHDFMEEPAILWWWAAIAGLLDEGSQLEERGGRKFFLRAAATAALAGFFILPGLWAHIVWRSKSPASEKIRVTLNADADFAPALDRGVGTVMSMEKLDWDSALKALQWSRRACRSRKGIASVWDRSASLQFKMASNLGAFPELINGARRDFRQAQILEPHLPWYPYHRALLERSAGRLDAAEGALEEALENEKHFTRALLLRARIRLDLGDSRGARRDLSAAEESRALLRSGRAFLFYHQNVLEAPDWQFHQLEDLLR